MVWFSLFLQLLSMTSWRGHYVLDFGLNLKCSSLFFKSITVCYFCSGFRSFAPRLKPFSNLPLTTVARLSSIRSFNDAVICCAMHSVLLLTFKLKSVTRFALANLFVLFFDETDWVAVYRQVGCDFVLTKFLKI